MAIDLTKPYTSADFAQSMFPTPQPQVQFPTSPTVVGDLSQPINQLPSVTTAGLSPNMDPYPTSFLPNMKDLSSPPPDQDILDITEMMKPQTKYQDEYSGLLKQQPQREKPGWGRRILAGLGTLESGPDGSQAEADRYKYEPYYHQMEGFKQKEAILKDLSDNERQANVNNRQMGLGLLTDLRGRKRLEEENRKNLAREHISRRLNEIRALTEENMNLMPIFEKDGTVWLVDRKSGAKTNMGIKGQDMDEFQRLILVNAGQAARDALNNQAASERQQAEFAHQANLARIKAQAEKDRKSLSPGDEKILQYNNARELANSDPTLAQYLAFDTASNSFIVKKPQEIPGWIPFVDSQGRNRASAQKYIGIVRYIYGDESAKRSIPADVLTMAGVDRNFNILQPSARSVGAGPGNTGQTQVPDADRRNRVKAILETAKKSSDEAAINAFLRNNPGFK